MIVDDWMVPLCGIWIHPKGVLQHTSCRDWCGKCRSIMEEQVYHTGDIVWHPAGCNRFPLVWEPNFICKNEEANIKKNYSKSLTNSFYIMKFLYVDPYVYFFLILRLVIYNFIMYLQLQLPFLINEPSTIKYFKFYICVNFFYPFLISTFDNVSSCKYGSVWGFRM